MLCLAFGGGIHGGRATLPAPADGCRLAAEATADALRGMLPQGVALGPLDLRHLRLGGHEAVATALASRGRVLMGIAPVAGDPRESSVRAVLHATNRRWGAGDGWVRRVRAGPAVAGGPADAGRRMLD